MLAQRLPTILPPLDFEEALEVTKVYSVAGKLAPGQGLVRVRPFRAPHHTVSEVALVGGGLHPLPGEVSLAHRGVLFLDELPEFRKNALEVLRQPLEDGRVTIARAGQSLTYPAACMLVAAMNPCPCGYYGDPDHECTCRPDILHRYRNRLSGPLLDRIDVHVEVPAVPYEDLRGGSPAEDSSTIRKRVLAARERQNDRYVGTACRCNADLGGFLLERYCALDAAGHALMEQAVRAPSTPKNFIRGMLPAEKAEEMTGVERDGDFSLHPKPSPPFKAPLFPFRKSCSGYQARRAAVDGAWCLAVSGMHSMI